MADTGEKVCGAVDSTGSWSDFTITRLNSSDNSRATHLNGQTYGIVKNFNFGIPTGATIDGIEVIIEGVAGGGTRGIIVSLSWDGKTTWTDTKTNTWGTTEADKSYGGATDTWGRTWSYDEFADGTFYLRVLPTVVAGVVMAIDYLRVKVYYTQNDVTVSPPALALNVTEAALGLEYLAASPALSFNVNENQSAMLFSSTPAVLALNITEATPGAGHTLLVSEALGLAVAFNASTTQCSAAPDALSLNLSEPTPVATLTALASALGLDVTVLSPGVGLVVFPDSLGLALTFADAAGKIIYPAILFAASRARDLAMTAEQRDTSLMAQNRDTRLDAEARDTNLTASRRDTNLIAEQRND